LWPDMLMRSTPSSSTSTSILRRPAPRRCGRGRLFRARPGTVPLPASPSRLVVRHHHRDQDGPVVEGLAQGLGREKPVAIDRQVRDLEAAALQESAGVEDRGVLDRRGDDPPPFSWSPKAAPFSARLSASEPPPVNTMRRGLAFTHAATCRRAFSTASRAPLPAEWMLEGLPCESERNGSIASRTSSARRVVALLSR